MWQYAKANSARARAEHSVISSRQHSYCHSLHSSDAASGWAGWALAHPEFGSSVNPIPTRGADYAHHINTRPHRIC